MREDFIKLEMDSFAHTLEHITFLKEKDDWDESIKVVGTNLRKLIGLPLGDVRKLSVTGLFAHLVKNAPMATVWIPFKQIKLIALLKLTGDYAARKDPPCGGDRWYLKALHLRLDASAKSEIDQYAHLAPTIEQLLASLGNPLLPKATQMRLIRERELNGLSAQVEEALLATLAHRTVPSFYDTNANDKE